MLAERRVMVSRPARRLRVTPLARLHSSRWTAGPALVLLAVFGAGVFLAGLELMITAVALPSILADLVAPNGTSAWIELRKASWIINGYLLVYILMMPLAGPAGRPVGRPPARSMIGARRSSWSARCWPGWPRTSTS